MRILLHESMFRINIRLTRLPACSNMGGGGTPSAAYQVEYTELRALKEKKTHYLMERLGQFFARKQ